MKFDITYLGVQAALPHRGGITTSQVVNVHEDLYLLDCGEGAQMKMEQWHIRRNKIRVVLISHLHGDHVFGLPGLITSFSHFQRTSPLVIVGPPGIREFLDTSLRISEAYIGFSLDIRELVHEGTACVYSDQNVAVSAFPLRHRVRTYGYRLDEQVVLNVSRQKIEEYQLTPDQIRAVRQKTDVNVKSGQKVPWTEIVSPKNVPRSYGFCTDTAYYPEIVEQITGVDVLYHEATYLSDMQQQAAERFHSTAAEAGRIAAAAGVQQLVLGHLSSRYFQHSAFVEEAGEYMGIVMVAEEGLIVSIPQKKTQ